MNEEWKKIRDHYALMLTLAEAKVIHEVVNGKRTRISLSRAIKSECQAVLKHLAAMESEGKQ